MFVFDAISFTQKLMGTESRGVNTDAPPFLTTLYLNISVTRITMMPVFVYQQRGIISGLMLCRRSLVRCTHLVVCPVCFVCGS